MIEDAGNGGSDPGGVARDTSQYKVRPPRFPIQTPLQYRQNGELEWLGGVTINISRSGVLFRADKTVATDAVLEMQIVFPAEVTGEIPARVFCSGPVVRTAPPDALDHRPVLAAAISRYRFARE